MIHVGDDCDVTNFHPVRNRTRTIARYLIELIRLLKIFYPCSFLLSVASAISNGIHWLIDLRNEKTASRAEGPSTVQEKSV